MTLMGDNQRITTNLVINRVSMGPTLTQLRPKCALACSRVYAAEKLQINQKKTLPPYHGPLALWAGFLHWTNILDCAAHEMKWCPDKTLV